MSDDLKDPTIEIAKEIAKQLPVRDFYEDGLAPAVKESGELLADVVKVLRLVLAPIHALGAVQDRYKRFIQEAVARVPEVQQVSPPPQILGPVLEGIRYEPEGTPIDEMFSELLSRSVDRERVNEAHPSYAYLIQQLSSDEVKILRLLADTEYEYTYTRDFDSTTRLFSGHHIEKDDLPKEGLAFPENAIFYMDHLHSLGIAGLFQHGNQEAIEEIYKNPAGKNHQRQIGTRVFSRYRLTDQGQRFVTACTSKSK